MPVWVVEYLSATQLSLQMWVLLAPVEYVNPPNAPHIGNPSWDTQHYKGMGNLRLSSWMDVLYCWEHQIPPGRFIYWNFTIGWLTRMGLLHTPRWGLSSHSSLRSICPAVSRTYWNALHLEWGVHHWKIGEGGDFVPAYPARIPSSHMVLFPLADVHVMHNQVTFLKLPNSFSIPDGHVLFSTGTIIWPLSLFHLLAWRML